ncbi:MAG: CvpA family protein [Defluviimonas sp.]|uniref:CvpA family protein n=1 Tax=Albidovulum sp. TaxID=1872424 RepID=UPI001D3997FF|nr:CvpA family protein [Paracoccaceae bacterium]MCC0064795.1 CvpA family protein [Defluviimonas sp.]
MDTFTIVDAVVAAVIIISAILAYSRGLVREVLAIAGWVAAAVVAFVFARQAEPLMKQVPYLDKFIGDSCELSTLAAFVVIFAVALIVMSIFTPLFSSAIQRSALGGLDQGLGFLFGVLRGVVLVVVAFVVYDRFLADASVPVVDKSRSAQIFGSLQGKLNAEVPDNAPGWIKQRYQELVSSCGGAGIAPETGATTGTGASTVTVPGN